MTDSQPPAIDLAEQMNDLRQRLQEAEDTLEAIRTGAIDAIVVDGASEQQIFTLKSADYTYRILIESMNQGAVTIDKEGTILYSNQQFSTMVDVPLERIIGSRIQSYIVTPDLPQVQKLIRGSGSKNKSITVDAKREPCMSLLLSATRLSSEEMTAYMCIVVTDMTERKKADDAKDEFISLASHQLRTPATGVKQYLGMLLEGYVGELSENNRIYVKTAYDSNERQLTIINDILKTAQIDSDMYELQKSKHDLAALITEVLADYEPIFSMRKQKTSLELDPNVTLDIDRKEMSLVIANIIENASKYSPEKSQIDIKTYRKGSRALIEVSDRGVGILESDLDRIFDKFTRINNTISDTVNGSGLGLYWVKRIVMLHNGTIAIKSTINSGSTFIVSLPV
jgi:PAS domain S-box-containing protein